MDRGAPEYYQWVTRAIKATAQIPHEGVPTPPKARGTERRVPCRSERRDVAASAGPVQGRRLTGPLWGMRQQRVKSIRSG